MVRFDKPCRQTRAAVNYFRQHLRVGDYLSEDGQAEMHWFGIGAKRLGLEGPCDLAALERLCAGQHPATGTKLGVRDKGSARRVCYFAQISAPKDVSIALLVGGDRRIEAWWREAVSETLHEIEAVTATRVRRADAQTDRVTGNLVGAVVTHDTSRALDPQLHTHLCAINITFDAVEARWKSVQPHGYLRYQGYFREVCYNRLALRLTSAGYELDPQRGIGFTIRGFPERLRSEFSERRAAILAAARASGATSQDALQAITARTRAAKRHATAADLRAGWEARAGADLATVQAVIAGTYGRVPRPPAMSPVEALESASAHVYERRSVVTRRDLLREALIYGRGAVALGDLRGELSRTIAAGTLQQVGEELASRAGMLAENEFTAWAHAGRAACPALGRITTSPQLSPEQQAAVAGILNSPSRLTLLTGDAGTGKTTALRAVVAGIEAAGGQVFGCAPSSAATDVLRRELTPDAHTLQHYLASPALQDAMRSRVLLIDEAGLISVRQLRDLCRLAAQHNQRLLLVGDTKQHSSVEAGDAFRCLQTFAQVPTFRLTEIHRQRQPGCRAAVALLARGHALAAFHHFLRLGAVREHPDESALFRLAATDYVARTLRSESCAVIAPVWSEIATFTAEVRPRLRAAGLLHPEECTRPIVTPLGWTQTQRNDLRNYQPGHVLQFHRESARFRKGERLTVVSREETALLVAYDDGAQGWFHPRQARHFDVGLAQQLSLSVGERLLIRANAPSAHLRNGDIVAVAAIHPDGALALRDGRTLPAAFREFTHGYATTSHASQGRTVDHGMLLIGEAGLAATNLKTAYVANSRFRESQTLYITDRHAARRAMQTPAHRKLATELLAPSANPAPAPSAKIRAPGGNA